MVKKTLRSREEELDLKTQLGQVLQEVRMVMPGIQALIGFQFIAVFNAGFRTQLTDGEQRIHLAAAGLVALAAALALAPAALHRQTHPEKASSRLIKISAAFLTTAMLPLALGVFLDFALLCRVILNSTPAAWILASIVLMVYLVLWYVVPSVLRER